MVLVERFVRAVCDDGLDVSSVLVITYTKRTAGELRSRIRARLVELGRTDLARELDGAWISTIHGFCNRLLKTYPLAAGLDPRFRELDEAQGVGAARRGVRGGARRVLLRRRPRAPAAARDLRRHRPAPDADRRLRDAALGRPRPRARARRAARACPTRSRVSRTPRGVSPRTRPRRTRSAPRRRRRTRSRRTSRTRSGCSTSAA